VELLYSETDQWEKEYKEVSREGASPKWPELDQYKGQLADGDQVLLEVISTALSIRRQLTKLYTYAHLRHDEDIANDYFKGMYGRILSVYYEFSEVSSWIEPEILALPEETLERYLLSETVADYRFYLERLVKQKEHTLSTHLEALLASAGKPLSASSQAFRSLNDADIKFKKVVDGQGTERELSHGLYGVYLRSPDRVLRKHALQEMHNRFLAYENTVCELLNGAVQSHLFQAKARKYGSCLEAALSPNNIDTSVYRSLIAAVKNGIAALHKYVGLRKKLLGQIEGPEPYDLHLYDMYVDCVPAKLAKDYTFDEAVQLVTDSVAPLGSEYQEALRRGLNQERWVDRYENKNKRSGAYSSGCYDSKPYILMNFNGLVTDVFTLAHEAGHSMHSYLSRLHQPYQYADYPIFVAEVASTFNEALLFEHMLKSASSKDERMYIINRKLEDIRGTLFRQTMFAEFELMIHEFAEKNVPLTPALLKDEYKKLNEFYFGPDAIIDEEIAIEWARIPHFYYNFYVYQYATGISAAEYLAKRVLNGGDKEREEYLSFLKGGSAQYPLDTLKMAGVDMSKPEPVQTVIDTFSSLVDQLQELTAS